MSERQISVQFFILCRNRPDFARQSIQSAMRQTVNRLEIVISDNSTDGSVESLVRSEFPDLEYRRRTDNFSVFDHLNRCLTEATADYVCLFHDDDLLSPHFTECIVETIARYPDAAAISVNAWVSEKGKPSHLSFRTAGEMHIVRDPRQLAAHYFSRHQPGIAPFPGYVYATARIRDLRFEGTGGKYADVTWMLGVAARGEIVWIVEPLMTTRLHASNIGRDESIGDRLKLFGFLKKHESTLGRGLIEDFRFFLYKKLSQMHRKNILQLSPMRNRIVRAYLTRYRCLRFTRVDHHRSLLSKTRARLIQYFRPQTFKYPHGAA